MLAYPVSFGPACWLAVWMADARAEMQTRQPIDVSDIMTAIYYPILPVWMYGPAPIKGIIHSYANLFAVDEASVVSYSDGTYRFIVYRKASSYPPAPDGYEPPLF